MKQLRIVVVDLEAQTRPMGKTTALIEEENIISLRTAFVFDDGDVADLRLMPGWLGSSDPISHNRRGIEWSRQDYAWLYRRMRSAVEETTLMNGFPCMEQDLLPLDFKSPPKMKLLWSDSGHSVALYLNNNPWAFIDERTHKGYSKGILKAATVNLWDQELFEEIFLKE